MTSEDAYLIAALVFAGLDWWWLCAIAAAMAVVFAFILK